MDCVLWAAQKAKEAENEDEPEGDSEENTQEEESTFAEGVLWEEEKAEIRSMSLPVLLAKEMPAVDTSDEGSPEDENDGDSGPSSSPQADRVAHLRYLLEKTQPGCLRHRHLAQMLRTEEHKKREEERSRAERCRQREDFLRSRGVSNLSLLSDDLDDPTPSPITRDLERYDQARVAAQEQARREAAREAFQGTWLISTKKDLRRCCERYQASDDSPERSTLKAYIKQMTGKLKNHHMSLGTFGTAEAVAERKRVCTLLGLLDQCQQHLVTSVAERLPLANRNGDGDGVEEEKEEEEQSIFVTPVPSSSARQSHPSARSDRTTTTEASKCKRASLSQRGTKKHCQSNKINKYFSSLKGSSSRLFLSLIPFSRAVVPNIHVLCSPPRAIAASDSEPLQQQSYVSGPQRLCSARCCSTAWNSRSPQSVDSESGERICPLHRRPVYSLALQACCAALHFLSLIQSRRSV